MLHGKQKLFEDCSFLQLSINTFELFKKKKKELNDPSHNLLRRYIPM